jgi:hypothetical protein
MPANRITTSSPSRRRLARSSSLSIGGRSRAPRRIRPELWAAMAISFCIGAFVFFIHDRPGGTHRGQKRGDRRASPGHHRSAGSPSGQAAFYLAARDRQANHSDARGWLRDASAGGKVSCPEYGIKPRIGMENETIKQAVNGGPRDCVYLCTHNAAEIGDGRLAILDVAGLPEIRQWFVVRPAAKRMMPAARSLREFLVAEGRSFLPNLKHGRRGGKTPAARGNHSAKRK